MRLFKFERNFDDVDYDEDISQVIIAKDLESAKQTYNLLINEDCKREKIEKFINNITEDNIIKIKDINDFNTNNNEYHISPIKVYEFDMNNINDNIIISTENLGS